MNPNIFLPHLWLVFASIGFVLAILSLVESTIDFMTTRPTNGFRMLALGDMAAEAIRLVFYGAYGAIGIWALRTGVVPEGWVSWVLFAGLLLIVVKTVLQLLVRRYLRATHPGETGLQREDREAGVERRSQEESE